MGGGSIQVIVLVAAACLSLGILIFWWGLRGRRLDDHPICRACGFDLLGIAPDTPCPECGADVGSSRARRIGHRERRRGAIAAGLVLALAGVLLFGAFIWGSLAKSGLNPYKPAWMLAMDARGGDRTAAAAALSELATRLKNGTLAQDRIKGLVARAMAVQADPNIPWIPEWGTLIDTAVTSGAAAGNPEKYVSLAEFHKYVERGFEIKPSTRARIREGAGLPLNMIIKGVRLGYGRMIELRLLGVDGSYTLDGAERTFSSPQGSTMRTSGPTTGGGSSSFGSEVAVELPRGKHTVTLTARLKIGRPDLPNGMADTVVTHAAEVEVVGPDEPLVTMVPDEQMRPKLIAAIQTPTLTRQRAGQLNVDINFRSVPADLSLRVMLRERRADGTIREYRVTTLAAATSPNGYGQGSGFNVPADLTAKAVDVVLAPDPAAGEATPWMVQAWDGEPIVFENVPITDEAAGGP